MLTTPLTTPLQALAATPAAPLIAQCEFALRAERTVAAVASDLGLADSAALTCQFKESVLSVFVQSAAQGAKLRQAAPRLRTALQKQGVNLSELRIRVQARHLTQAKVTEGQQSSAPLPSRSNLEAALKFSSQLALTSDSALLRNAALRLRNTLNTLNEALDQQDHEEQDRRESPHQEKPPHPL
jgi:hypothetical protein